MYRQELGGKGNVLTVGGSVGGHQVLVDWEKLRTTLESLLANVV